MSSSEEGPLTPAATMYCWRCDDVIRAVTPWPHWNKVWWAWCGMIVLITVVSPVMGSDYFCMIPTMMGIIVAGGPIYRYAHEKPTCSVCSAELDPSRRAGTGVRAKSKRSKTETQESHAS